MLFNIRIGPYLLSAILFGLMSLNSAQDGKKKHCWADALCIWYEHGSFYEAQSDLVGYIYEGIRKADYGIITYSQKTKWTYQAKDAIIAATGYRKTLLLKSKGGLSKFDLSSQQQSIINNSHSGWSNHWILISGENNPYGIVQQQDESFALVNQKWLEEGTSDFIPNACLQEFSLVTKVTGCQSSIFKKLNYGFLYSSELHLISKDKKWVLVFDGNWLKGGAKTELKKIRKFPDFFSCETSTVSIPESEMSPEKPGQSPISSVLSRLSGFPFLLDLFPPRSKKFSTKKLVLSWFLHILGLILISCGLYNVPKLCKQNERQPGKSSASSSQSYKGGRLSKASQTVRSSSLKGRSQARSTMNTKKSTGKSRVTSTSALSSESSRIIKKSGTSKKTTMPKRSGKAKFSKFRPKSPVTSSKSAVRVRSRITKSPQKVSRKDSKISKMTKKYSKK